MCRWNAYFGQPVLIDELLFRTQHSLIDQSLHSRMGVETTNGDGFGVGWYRDGNGGTPAPLPERHAGVERREPARSRLAHRVAAVPRPHPRDDRNPGAADQLPSVPARALAVRAQRRHQRVPGMRRDLLFAVDPSLFDGIAGSTDSEALFYLALTFGLEDDPLGAVEQAVGFVEATGRAHGIENPVQMTLGFSDGERLYAVRYSSEHRSRTLFVSEDVESVRALHPDNARFQRMTAEDRVVVSEPVSDLPGAWREVPESTALIIQRGPDEQREFHPRVPSDARSAAPRSDGRGRELTDRDREPPRLTRLPRAGGAPHELCGERADEHREGGARRIALVDAGDRPLALIPGSSASTAAAASSASQPSSAACGVQAVRRSSRSSCAGRRPSRSGSRKSARMPSRDARKRFSSSTSGCAA